MSESHEARQLEIFGSKLFFETNAVAPDGPGKVAYLMSSQTSDKVKYNQDLFLNFDRKNHSQIFFDNFTWTS